MKRKQPKPSSGPIYYQVEFEHVRRSDVDELFESEPVDADLIATGPGIAYIEVKATVTVDTIQEAVWARNGGAQCIVTKLTADQLHDILERDA